MTQKPRIPAGLGPSGASLWRSVLDTYDELDPRELALLGHACRQSDTIGDLEALLKSDGLVVVGSTGQPRLNQVVAELRQARLAVSRLLADLDLPAPDGRPRTTSHVRRRNSLERK
ncbi:MAG: hypothetical protein WCP28_07170 [Actinomycetes bacterium]